MKTTYKSLLTFNPSLITLCIEVMNEKEKAIIENKEYIQMEEEIDREEQELNDYINIISRNSNDQLNFSTIIFTKLDLIEDKNNNINENNDQILNENNNENLTNSIQLFYSKLKRFISNKNKYELVHKKINKIFNSFTIEFEPILINKKEDLDYFFNKIKEKLLKNGFSNINTPYLLPIFFITCLKDGESLSLFRLFLFQLNLFRKYFKIINNDIKLIQNTNSNVNNRNNNIIIEDEDNVERKQKRIKNEVVEINNDDNNTLIINEVLLKTKENIIITNNFFNNNSSIFINVLDFISFYDDNDDEMNGDFDSDDFGSEISSTIQTSSPFPYSSSPSCPSSYFKDDEDGTKKVLLLSGIFRGYLKKGTIRMNQDLYLGPINMNYIREREEEDHVEDEKQKEEVIQSINQGSLSIQCISSPSSTSSSSPSPSPSPYPYYSTSSSSSFLSCQIKSLRIFDKPVMEVKEGEIFTFKLVRVSSSSSNYPETFSYEELFKRTSGLIILNPLSYNSSLLKREIFVRISFNSNISSSSTSKSKQILRIGSEPILHLGSLVQAVKVLEIIEEKNNKQEFNKITETGKVLDKEEFFILKLKFKFNPYYIFSNQPIILRGGKEGEVIAIGETLF